ncbi:MAG: hypothetical protein MJ007_02105 [Paludibacteraceae bacterium]|nr:hypothetical protein [Paludibacteraceae bacterium]
MNIAQELSIVRDNIAEYGMTNITQLEYDEIYEQGRAEAIDECIKTLAKSEDTMLSDRQYYTLIALKEQE